MKKGVYKIAEQVNGYGFYAEIELECEITAKLNEVELSIDEESHNWKTGVLFGCVYFLEHCLDCRGLHVNVKHLKEHAVDTTSTIVAYVTINALKEALGASLTREPDFDITLKSFVFPK